MLGRPAGPRAFRRLRPERPQGRRHRDPAPPLAPAAGEGAPKGGVTGDGPLHQRRPWRRPPLVIAGGRSCAPPRRRFARERPRSPEPADAVPAPAAADKAGRARRGGASRAGRLLRGRTAKRPDRRGGAGAGAGRSAGRRALERARGRDGRPAPRPCATRRRSRPRDGELGAPMRWPSRHRCCRAARPDPYLRRSYRAARVAAVAMLTRTSRSSRADTLRRRGGPPRPPSASRRCRRPTARSTPPPARFPAQARHRFRRGAHRLARDPAPLWRDLCDLADESRR